MESRSSGLLGAHTDTLTLHPSTVALIPRVAVKMGSCLRYRRVDLDAWIAAHLEPADERE